MDDLKITLEAARVNAGLSQEQAANKLGVSRYTLLKWEKGKTSPSVKQGRELSDLYRWPLERIFLPN